ncbi:transposase [Enhygromyxa salina]|uniref:transposase n=1 Tax=Enhygromyxa salina TaxID=215803 RepID=UPI0006991CFE|nr:transposase [Enhygromyxa salina]
MTLPRPIVPGRTYLITRRCSERRFFLRPTSEITQIFEYALAHAAADHNIELHAFVAMSNHYHLVATDPDGNLPAFQRDLNSLLARAINRAIGRKQSVWDSDSYNAVHLLEPESVLEKMAYTILNPVRARLVGRAVDWQGATSVGMGWEQVRVIRRPTKFFREERDMPKEVTLHLTPPPDTNPVEVQSRIAEGIARGEHESKADGPPLGMRKVLAQSHNSSPDSVEPFGALKPRFAARCAELRALAVSEYRRWVDSYRAALALFNQGQRDVEFPLGTYRMCRELGCLESPA